LARRATFEEELQALSPVAADPHAPDAATRLAAGLASKRSLVVARAARLVREHALEGHEPALADACARFLVDPVKSDPSCQAKLAALEALDYAESTDAEPFLRAARHVQREGSSDTAAPLRARAVLGLARIGHPDFDLVAATLLGDAQPPVRQAALDALVHRGDRAGAALALHKLRAGDDDPLVTLAAMAALLALAPDWGRAELGALLDDADGTAGERREWAAVALGQARGDEGLTLLLGALDRCVRADEREPILRGIGLHRSERALAALLPIIADGAAADARAAIEALAARRYDPGIAERVRDAAAANERVDLAAVVAERFDQRA